MLAYDPAMTSDSAASPPMSPRAREIVAAARELLEAEGSVSMRRLADRLGIKAPSLYKHVRDKGALEAALISDAFLDAAERFERAGDIDELGAAYRAFALEHPHLYRLMYAFAHGMVILELGGRFPDGADLDAAWARGLRAFAT